MSTAATNKPAYNVKNPFIARLKRAFDLTGPGASKNTRHYEIDLTGSGMEFLPGDSLAVLPTNDPALVDLILQVQGFSGSEVVPHPKGGETTIRQALIEVYAITEVDSKILKAVADKAGNSELLSLTTPERKEDLKKYLWGSDVLDILQENPTAKFEPAELAGLLRKLNIRLYSISSSLAANPEQVHLTVATVRYESHGRMRGGVCSTFLADRIDESTPPAHLHQVGRGLPSPRSGRRNTHYHGGTRHRHRPLPLLPSGTSGHGCQGQSLVVLR
ncbi:hypothetical protein [Verrucomicrobium sp. BvORR034]|uniref:hypothetical protein n=1 Tax=Verrucomicrobium sp. BvORR034 TaxID=1396418 RepID=UPI0006790007|nr:hypothetical protein [Verrucomicrobium sp. BvORR034]